MSAYLPMLSCAEESLYHQYQSIYTYLQVLMYMYKNCSKFYNKMTTFKITQEELQDIQCFWLQDLEIDHPKLSWCYEQKLLVKLQHRIAKVFMLPLLFQADSGQTPLDFGQSEWKFFCYASAVIFRWVSAACPGISGQTCQSNRLFRQTSDGLSMD